MCWIYTGYVGHSGINAPVSSHLLDSPKASSEEPNHSKDGFPGRLQQVPGHSARSRCSGVGTDYMLLPGLTEHSWKQGERKSFSVNSSSNLTL